MIPKEKVREEWIRSLKFHEETVAVMKKELAEIKEQQRQRIVKLVEQLTED